VFAVLQNWTSVTQRRIWINWVPKLFASAVLDPDPKRTSDADMTPDQNFVIMSFKKVHNEQIRGPKRGSRFNGTGTRVVSVETLPSHKSLLS
jgi:hypothetical protein